MVAWVGMGTEEVCSIYAASASFASKSNSARFAIASSAFGEEEDEEEDDDDVGSTSEVEEEDEEEDDDDVGSTSEVEEEDEGASAGLGAGGRCAANASAEYKGGSAILGVPSSAFSSSSSASSSCVMLGAS
jgi:hypothetical protein